jgi:periplasmic divalent cation tolerance protein
MQRAKSIGHRVKSSIIIFATFPDLKTAKKIVRGLVQARLAACGNIFRISSLFSWKGRMEDILEYAALIKTTRENYSRVEGYIRKNHPYEVPEIIAWPITRGLKEYSKWLDVSVR